MSKRLAIAALLFATITVPLHADFKAVARAIDSQRGVDRVWIPFLGVARALVRAVQPEGIYDFQLVTFTTAEPVDPRKLNAILEEKAGPGYKPLVKVWSRRSNEWSFIYAKPSSNAGRIDLLVLAHDDEETVLVRVDVDTEMLTRELGDDAADITRIARR